MRAYRVYGPGKSGIEEIPKPTPGPEDVVIRVGAAGLCHTDVDLAATAAHMGAQLPLTGGHEIAGHVDAVGASVSGIREGDAVAVYQIIGCGRCRACLGGEDNLCSATRMQVYGVTRDGGLAEYVKVRSRDVFAIGDLDVPQASVLTDAGLTAYGSVKHAVDLLRPGSAALVIGVGGLGHLAIQFIRALTPATVIAVDIDDARLELARSVGAHHAVMAGESAAEEIRRIVPAGVDASYDFVANDAAIALGQKAVRVGGAIAITGMGHSTFALTTGFDSPVPPEVRIVRTLGGSRRDLEDVFALARTGRVTATVSINPLKETDAQVQLLASGGVVGRSVIVP